MMTNTILIAGVDEAGRGPWAGPVVAAAVILDPTKPILGLKDSKQLSEAKRDKLFIEICANALCFGIAEASHEEVDSLNILQATFVAMQRAVDKLIHVPHKILVDGNKSPFIEIPSEAIVDGDAKEQSIAAASILAKVTRDRLMIEWHHQFPDYGFDKHKGYGTKNHQEALAKFGVTAIHRKSYKPIQMYLQRN